MKKLITGLALATLSWSAQAQNLVTNGDFENGLSGWTKSAFPPGAGFDSREVTFFAPSGPNKFYSTGTTVQTSLFQSMNTVAGTLYDLSFQLRGLTAPETPVNYAKVVFGTYEFVPASFDGGTFTTFTYKGLVAGAGPSLLTYTASSNISYVHLDNVSIQVSAVPEPKTFVMLLIGLGLIGHALRRHRQG